MAPLHLSGVTLVRPTKDKADTEAGLLNKYMTGGFNPDDEDDVAAAKANRLSKNKRYQEHQAAQTHIFIEDQQCGLYEREKLFADTMARYCKDCFDDPKELEAKYMEERDRQMGSKNPELRKLLQPKLFGERGKMSVASDANFEQRRLFTAAVEGPANERMEVGLSPRSKLNRRRKRVGLKPVPRFKRVDQNAIDLRSLTAAERAIYNKGGKDRSLLLHRKANEAVLLEGEKIFGGYRHLKPGDFQARDPNLDFLPENKHNVMIMTDGDGDDFVALPYAYGVTFEGVSDSYQRGRTEKDDHGNPVTKRLVKRATFPPSNYIPKKVNGAATKRAVEITRNHALSMGLPDDVIEEVVQSQTTRAQGGSRLKLPAMWDRNTKFSEKTRLGAKRRYMDSGTALDKFKRKRARARIREIRAILKAKQDEADAKIAPPGSRKAYALMKKREAKQRRKDEARAREKKRVAGEESRQRNLMRSEEFDAPPDTCCYGMFTRRVKIAKPDNAIKQQKAEEKAAEKERLKKERAATKAEVNRWREACIAAQENDEERPPPPACYVQTRDDPTCCDYLLLRTPNGIVLKHTVRPLLIMAWEYLKEQLPKRKLRLGADGLPFPPPPPPPPLLPEDKKEDEAVSDQDNKHDGEDTQENDSGESGNPPSPVTKFYSPAPLKSTDAGDSKSSTTQDELKAEKLSSSSAKKKISGFIEMPTKTKKSSIVHGQNGPKENQEENSETEGPLATGWREVVDPSTGNVYYNKIEMVEGFSGTPYGFYHREQIKSNEVVWEKPIEPPKVEETIEEYEERLEREMIQKIENEEKKRAEELQRKKRSLSYMIGKFQSDMNQQFDSALDFANGEIDPKQMLKTYQEAAEEGDYYTVQSMLMSRVLLGFDVDGTNREGSTALYNTVFRVMRLERDCSSKDKYVRKTARRAKRELFKVGKGKFDQVISLLLAVGADLCWHPDGPDTQPVGWGLLHHAVNDANADRIDWLLDKKYDPNDAALRTGLTPLMIAARNDNLELILKLLEAGADVGKIDEENRWSALHWATAYASSETVRYLLKAGATRLVFDKEWRSVVDLAHARKRKKIWELLVAHHEVDRIPTSQKIDHFEEYYKEEAERKEKERLRALEEEARAREEVERKKGLFDSVKIGFSAPSFSSAKNFTSSLFSNAKVKNDDGSSSDEEDSH